MRTVIFILLIFALVLLYMLISYLWKQRNRLVDPPKSANYEFMIRTYEDALDKANYDPEAEVIANAIKDQIMESSDAWHFERYLHNKRMNKLNKPRR